LAALDDAAAELEGAQGAEPARRRAGAEGERMTFNGHRAR
jgi:hypothetical protein